MKKSSIRNYVVTMAICLCMYIAFFLLMGDRVLRYQEGWETFYYSTDFVADVMARDGIMHLFRLFLLQFFAHPWHGAVVMALILGAITAVLFWIEARLTPAKLKRPVLSVVLSMCLAVLFAMFLSSMSFRNTIGMGSESERQSNLYIRLSALVREQKWDEIISLCEKHSPVVNLVHQNCLNMALAETGQLGERLMDQPCRDISSIYVSTIGNSQIAGLLSDIYYSMGHIALAQRYAFETNEKMDNMSPRMLQRLVQTNIIYGHYEVAKKYLYWLEKTLYYSDWCKHYSSLLSDEAVEADAEMSMKRRSLIPDNRFSAFNGLDDDLLHIARASKGTPQCRVTLQYLCSLYVLTGAYGDEFLAVIDEFGGTDELPEPLQKYIAQYYDYQIQNKSAD